MSTFPGCWVGTLEHQHLNDARCRCYTLHLGAQRCWVIPPHLTITTASTSPRVLSRRVLFNVTWEMKLAGGVCPEAPPVRRAIFFALFRILFFWKRVESRGKAFPGAGARAWWTSGTPATGLGPGDPHKASRGLRLLMDPSLMHGAGGSILSGCVVNCRGADAQ